MAQYQIKGKRPIGALPNYPGLNTLRLILDRNYDRCLEHYEQGNYILPNQNPLVQFLLQLSINPEWDLSQLKMHLELNIKKVASQVGFTSIYNRGGDHTLALFPESNHKTLIVIPFEENINTGVLHNNWRYDSALRPLMTTSTKHYWDPVEVIDSVERKLDEDVYSIVELSPAILAGLYWSYLRDRINKGINVGRSPHHFCMYVLISFYRQHNAITLFNLVSEADKLVIQKPDFAVEEYRDKVASYTSWLERYLLISGVSNFNEYVALCKPIFGSLYYPETLVPHRNKTIMFVQLAWAYTFSNLYWMIGFLKFHDFLGIEDGMEETALSIFFKISENFNANQIKDPNWKKRYIETWRLLQSR